MRYLANIQTCLDEGGHSTNSGMSVYGMVLNPEKGEKVANSVANGIKHARWEVLDTIPAPSKRTGEHYVLIELLKPGMFREEICFISVCFCSINLAENRPLIFHSEAFG